MRKASACLLLSDRSPTHQAREWWSAAEHFDRRFPASLRRDLVSLRATTKTPRRRLRCRAGNRLALLRYDVGRITIVAIPRGSIVAIPRRTDPHPARADGASEMRKGCSADTRRHRDPLWSRNCRPDHRPESATKGHGMAATKCVPASSQSFNRRRNQPGQENGEETACDSKGHSERLLRTALLLQEAWVLPSGKPTMDSRSILLALDLENGKRPCADYGGGSDARCKYYSHGTLANGTARLCCAGSNSLAIFVLKLREFASSRPCDSCQAPLTAAAPAAMQSRRRWRAGDLPPANFRPVDLPIYSAPKLHALWNWLPGSLIMPGFGIQKCNIGEGQTPISGTVK